MTGYKLLVGGELIDGPRRLDVLNPATAAVFATCPRADEAILNRAVAAAKGAFAAWSALAHGERAKRILALADALEADLASFCNVTR